jgi:hypothetical protein
MSINKISNDRCGANQHASSQVFEATAFNSSRMKLSVAFCQTIKVKRTPHTKSDMEKAQEGAPA